ncbi:MAG TPA: hypothetical protein VFE05_13295 [Longimicrobiaceae bacterium]|jgi:hypothetical protein|nr:hypothetical protein [Longimicrobiaceae bacterium]
MRHLSPAGDPRDTTVAFELVRRVRGSAPAGPYDGGYDVRRGYDDAPVVHVGPDADEIAYFGGRDVGRR